MLLLFVLLPLVLSQFDLYYSPWISSPGLTITYDISRNHSVRGINCGGSYRCAIPFSAPVDWLITEFSVYAYYESYASVGANGLSSRIWSGTSTLGAVVYGSTADNVYLSQSSTGVYKVRESDLSDRVRLVNEIKGKIKNDEFYTAAGSYWLEYSAKFSTSTARFSPSYYSTTGYGIYQYLSVWSYYPDDQTTDVLLLPLRVKGYYPVPLPTNPISTTTSFQQTFDFTNTKAASGGTIYCITSNKNISTTGASVISAAKAGVTSSILAVLSTPTVNGTKTITMSPLPQATSFTTYCAITTDGTNPITMKGNILFSTTYHATIAVICPSLTLPNGNLVCTAGPSGMNSYNTKCTAYCNEGYTYDGVTVTQSGVCPGTISIGRNLLHDGYNNGMYSLNTTNCTYVLTSADVVQISFNFFQLALTQGCTTDYIKIFNGPSTSSPPIGSSFCGAATPGTLWSTGNSLTIQFVTDNILNQGGWNLTYSSGTRVCQTTSQWNGTAHGCTLFDPCSDNGGCHPLRLCITNETSRICGPCPEGYNNSGETGCVDYNECSFQNGGCLSLCVNVLGSYFCGPTIANDSVEVVQGGSFQSPGSILLEDNISPSNNLSFIVYAGGDPTGRLNQSQTLINDIKITYGRIGQSDVLRYPCSSVSYNDSLVAPTTTFGTPVRVVCTLSSGIGDTLYFGIEFCHEAGSHCGVYRDESVHFSYPLPIITPSTIRSNGVATGNVYLNFTNTLASKIAFNGQYFLNDLNHLAIYYGPDIDPLRYVCSMDVTLTTTTTIFCTTQAGAAGQGYSITLVANVAQVRGTDVLNYPAASLIPVVTHVYGCTDDPSTNSTSNCTTQGSTQLTIIGENFGAQVSVSVAGSYCGVLQLTATSILCKLPAGVGFGIAVVVSSDSQYSAPVRLLSYGPPILTKISGCGRQDGLLQVSGCSRYGSSVLTLVGSNFGASGATVLIGTAQCQNVTHDSADPHSLITCTLPPQTKTNLVVILIQRNGAIGSTSALVSYDQCAPGYYLYGYDCRECIVGKYKKFSGADECLDCPVGRYLNATAGTDCLLCTQGSYQDTPGQTACLPCPLGTFLNALGQPQCTDCSVGSFSNTSGSIRCELCPPGTATNTTQSSSCRQCLPGYYAEYSGSINCHACPIGTVTQYIGSLKCTSCPNGTYQNLIGQEECIPCAIGSYQRTSGQVYCNLCPIGRYSGEEGASDCIDCDTGEFQDAEGKGSCTPCPLGRFNPSTGQTACKKTEKGRFQNQTSQSDDLVCSPGEYQDQEEQSSCKPCEKGKASAQASGAISCSPCAQGKYADKLGMSECLTCEAGYYQEQTGEPSCVPCPPGTTTEASRTRCVACPDGFFAPTPGSPECVSCPPISLPDPNGDKCLCKQGYYGDVTITREAQLDSGNHTTTLHITCTPCPPGADCSQAGTVFGTLGAKSGWWRKDTNSTTFYPCLNAQNCIGGYESTCGANRGGPICATCKPGYTSFTPTGKCSACPNKAASVGVTIIFLIIIIAGLGLMYYVVLQSEKVDIGEEWEYGRAPRLGATEYLRMSVTEYMPPISRSNSDASRRGTTNSRRGRRFSESSQPFWKRSISRNSVLEGPVKAPNSDILIVGEELMIEDQLSILDSGVLTPEYRSASNITYSLKIIVGFFQIVTSLVPTIVSVPWPSVYYQFISVFSFVNIDFIPWQSLACVSNLSYYDKLLITCLTPIIILSLVALFYLIPSYLLDRKDMEDTDIYRQNRKRRRQKWARIILFTFFLVYPKLAQTTTSFFSCRRIEGVDYLIDDFRVVCFDERWNRYLGAMVFFLLVYPIGVPVTFFVLLFINRKRLHTEIDTRMSLGFLYRAYAQSTWWFELMDMLNKLILVSLIRFAPKPAQLPWAMCVNGLYTIIILIKQPYIRSADERLHLLAQIEIEALLLAAYVLSTSSPDGLDEVSNVLLSILFIAILTLISGMFVLMCIIYIRRRYNTYQRLKLIEKEKLETGQDGSQKEKTEKKSVAAATHSQSRGSAYEEEGGAVTPHPPSAPSQVRSIPPPSDSVHGYSGHSKQLSEISVYMETNQE